MPTIRQLHRMWESQFEFFTRDKDFNLIPRKAMTEKKEILPLTEERCVNGCKHFTGGEIKHHPDCIFYPDSLSIVYDKKDEYWKQRLLEEVEKAYYEAFDWTVDKVTISEYMKELKERL